jgi:sialate O-acetylesterase
MNKIKGMVVVSALFFAHLALSATPVDLSVLPQDVERVDIYLLLGQSNMKGRGVIPAVQTPDPLIVHMNMEDDQWYEAEHPLHKAEVPDLIDGSDNAGVGPGLDFAKTLLSQTNGVRIALVPCAVGGSWINLWQPGQNFYTNAIYRAQKALADAPPGTARVKGVLWLQGESDAKDIRYAAYSGKLSTLVQNLRADLNEPDLPFIACSIGTFINSPNYPRVQEINYDLLTLPQREPHTACVDARDLSGHIGDNMHYNTASQEIIGARYAAEYAALAESSTNGSGISISHRTDFGTNYTVNITKEGSQDWKTFEFGSTANFIGIENSKSGGSGIDGFIQDKSMGATADGTMGHTVSFTDGTSPASGSTMGTQFKTVHFATSPVTTSFTLSSQEVGKEHVFRLYFSAFRLFADFSTSLNGATDPAHVSARTTTGSVGTDPLRNGMYELRWTPDNLVDQVTVDLAWTDEPNAGFDRGGLAGASLQVLSDASPTHMASYNDGTDTDAAALVNLATVSSNYTVSGLASVGFYEAAYITRTSFGATTPAGPTAGSAAGSEWLSARSTIIHDLGSASDYFGFTVTAAADHVLDLTSLKFDMAAASGVTNLATGYNFSTQVYVSQDGGLFAAIGSPLTASVADGVAGFSSVVSANIDLSSITGAGSVAIRIGVGDALIGADVNSQSAVGLVQGIQLNGSVVIGSPIVLANMFSSGCVLQRDRTVAVWGTCGPNETITVDIKSQSKSSVAGSNGNWRVELDPEPAGGPYVMIVSGANSWSKTLADVYFGDVWILTGQSNMFMPLSDDVSRFSDYYPAVPDATDDFDDIRIARIGNVSVSNAPAADVTMAMPWNRWEADSLEHMPVVGYFFARFLNEELDANGMDDVPLGVIRVCVGGSAIEEWIAAEEIDAAKGVNPELILKSGASRFYNGMIAPFQDYAIKGALWYQGEANAGSIERIEQYPLLKRTLVESWREQWNNPDLPFYFVQLAPYRRYSVIPSDELWPWMRDSQRTCLAITNTAMACIIDSGNQGTIHPSFKDRVGERLARIALTKTYGIPFVTRGPTVQNVQISGSDVTITFDNIAAGLETRTIDSESDAAEIAAGFPPVSISADELGGFALCGTNQTFYWATQAEIISSNQVRISNAADVSDPVDIRYAWQDYPRCNLFNSEGLPAEPFRTDAYEYSTSDGADSTPHSSGISNQTAYAAQNSLQINLPSVFRDIEDGGSNLMFFVTGNTAVQVVDSASVSNQILALHFSGTNGTSTVSVSAQDSAGHTVVASFDLSVETTTYQAWRHECFTVNQLGDSGQESTVWGDTADPDGDGTVNLLEYAWALNPLESNQPPDSLAILFENGEIKARFLKSKKIDTDPSVTVGIQTSPDLTDSEGWTPIGTSDVFYQDRGETELREILLPQDPQTQFVRLVVSRVE